MKRHDFSTCLAALALLVSLPAAAQREYTDQDVSDVVDRELLYDPAVSPNGIDVSTTDGIVTLSGSVRSLLEKERAARLAETVKGVRSVVSTLVVVPPVARTDAEVASAVENALLHDPATESYDVTVRVEDGHVILTGTVQSWTERELCATVAKSVAGARALTNEISVSVPADRPDVEIRSEIERSLRWNALVDDALINVGVENGRVTLDGIVGSAAEKRQARLDAWTAGVRSVDDSRLEVARWARDDDLRGRKYVRRSEDEIVRALTEAMATDPRVASFHVAPSVSGGVVTLRGVVDNLKASRAAEQDAKHTVGVRSVENHLKIRPDEERSEDAIAQDVRRGLLADPHLDRLDIGVAVHDGTVTLTGEVDSYYEKGQADDIASRTNGVTDVVNRLRVEDELFTYDPFVDEWNIYSYPWYRNRAWPTFETDWQIESNIEGELFWSPFVDADDVMVEVEDGVATLTGTVDSWLEWAAAQEDAYEGGAVRVRNRLGVAGSSALVGEASSRGSH